MYKVDGKDVYTDDFSCRYRLALNMYTLEDGGTRLCVTRKQCVERGGFLFMDSDGQPFKCLTGSECSRQYWYGYNNNKYYFYAYAATGTCIGTKPRDLDDFDPD